MGKNSEEKKAAPRLPYWKERQQLKLKAPHGKQEKAKAVKEKKEEISTFYKQEASKSPGLCENCKKSLYSTIKQHPRGHICHIVPKTGYGGIPSVATNENNRWFGCSDCHDIYDDAMAKGEFEKVIRMPVFPIIVARFRKFFKFIKQSERRRIPACLLNDKGNPIQIIPVHDKSGKTEGSDTENT